MTLHPDVYFGGDISVLLHIDNQPFLGLLDDYGAFHLGMKRACVWKIAGVRKRMMPRLCGVYVRHSAIGEIIPHPDVIPAWHDQQAMCHQLLDIHMI